MSYLIYTDFDVGGLPTLFAEILHSHGVPLSFINVSPGPGHDSGAFHYGDTQRPYNVTHLFPPITEQDAFIEGLKELKKCYSITRAFATGVSSWMLYAAGIEYNYWTYGSDVNLYATDVPYALWGRGAYRPPLFSRKAIQREYDDEVLAGISNWRQNQIRILDTLRCCRKIYYSPYQASLIKKIIPGKPSFFLPHLCAEIDETALRAMRTAPLPELTGFPYVVSVARHCWRGGYRLMPDNKGNDTAVMGFADYLKRNGDSELHLVLIKKGADGAATQRVAEELGVAERVVWLEEMPRPALGRLYAGAVASLGAFNTPVIEGGALEALAFGTPCITYFQPIYSENPPLLNAHTPRQIGALLHKLIASPGFHRKVSDKGRLWVSRNCTREKFTKAFLKAMES